VLRDLKLPSDEHLIVGIATGDDAGVYRIAEGVAVVQTLDFFTPIVDDPYRFGQIAAANSLSDVYAMGGRPVTVMNILCFPIGARDINELGAILRGGADKIAEAGAALVGGHSVDDPEPKYGLAVTGLIDPDHVATNAGARPGDVIVLTKPLGTGIITTAAKFDECPPEALDAACDSMAQLNAGAARAMNAVGIEPGGVHAATDITGFGLLGHLLNLARVSGVRLEINAAAIPALPEAERLSAAGNTTRGERENAEYLAEGVQFAQEIPAPRRSLMCDPQTSGGLAIFVAEARAGDLLAALEREGVATRAVIGHAVAGEPGITVRMKDER
jgi:selenide,water dikinase